MSPVFHCNSGTISPGKFFKVHFCLLLMVKQIGLQLNGAESSALMIYKSGREERKGIASRAFCTLPL